MKKIIKSLILNLEKPETPQEVDLIIDGGGFKGSYILGNLLYLKEMEKQGFELGRLYTDKDKPPFKTNLTEGKRWKVYIQGESEPFIIGGKNERDVKELAHQMTYPTRIKIKKIVREIKESEQGEGKMAQGQLKRITELSNMIQQQFNDNTNLEEWVEAKITKAEDYLSSVFNYIRGDKS